MTNAYVCLCAHDREILLLFMEFFPFIIVTNYKTIHMDTIIHMYTIIQMDRCLECQKWMGLGTASSPSIFKQTLSQHGKYTKVAQTQLGWDGSE